MTSISAPLINDYANAMFRHEHLHDDWIGRCADHLRRVFGGGLEGKCVLDYGFGRGNWSLAFLRAGAEHVVAVDAAEDNVARLHRYCRERDVPDIEIVHGNILVEPIAAIADIVWLYGVLHHIDAAEMFVGRLAALAPSPDALFFIYAYERGSPREFIVETCRRFARYTSEDAFRRDSLVLSRAARLRARDDLVAPCVRFYGARELYDLLRREHLAPLEMCAGLAAAGAAGHGNEFRPHEWLCTRIETNGAPPPEPERPYAGEIAVLRSMADAVGEAVTEEDERRRLALGLFNAHFSAMANGGGAEAALVEDFLYLLYVLLARNANLSGLAETHPCVDLALAKMKGKEHPHRDPEGGPTVFARWLSQNRPRV